MCILALQATPDDPRPASTPPSPPPASPTATPKLRPTTLRDPTIAPRTAPPPRHTEPRGSDSRSAAGRRDVAGLRAARLFAPPSGPVEVIIRGADPQTQYTLLLIDSAGEVLGTARELRSGKVDLLSTLPGVQGMHRAAWLQLAANDEAVGSPLVIQPLREPPPVRTVRSKRPDGTTEFTKVVGWGSEALDPDDTTIDELKRTWIDGDPPVLSGYRMYPDMDVLVRTDHGEMRIALAPHEAPATAWNFRTLVREGFYDRGGFHRIVPADREGRPFVIQGGDPTLSGNGGPGHVLALEPSRLPHDYGVLSMARADEPHSAGSQFFIALGREATARLDGQYCAFGFVVSGARTIDSIAATPIADASTGRPQAIPVILSMQLVAAPARMPGTDRNSERVKPITEAGSVPPTVR